MKQRPAHLATAARNSDSTATIQPVGRARRAQPAGAWRDELLEAVREAYAADLNGLAPEAIASALDEALVGSLIAGLRTRCPDRIRSLRRRFEASLLALRSEGRTERCDVVKREAGSAASAPGFPRRAPRRARQPASIAH